MHYRFIARADRMDQYCMIANVVFFQFDFWAPTCLDYLIERLKSEAPVATRRSIAPYINWDVGHEVVFGPLQASILRHLVEECTVRVRG